MARDAPQQMDIWRLYQVDPANVDANTCKVFSYVIDMGLHAIKYAKHYFVDFNKTDLILFKKLCIRIP